MHNTVILRFASLLISLSLLAGCSSTRLVTSWRDDSFRSGQLSKPMVMAVVQKDYVRMKLEDEFVAKLGAMGVQAVQSYKFFPDLKALNADMVKAKTPETGRDSLLVTRLVDVKKETVYVPGSTQYFPGGPPGYYNNFNTYYASTYSMVTTPGYTYDYKVYTLETNLYDASTHKLIWTAVTETEETSSVDSALIGFAETVTKNLKKSNLF